ncbi:pyrophosphatase PpaX [Marinilactibacillus piezotolerans]|uniref:Pyrophosphatase PpaX n=2 Tax=Marinilactibacillus TaxID=191769 RepID=A0A1I3WZW6_9LACT|nr:HAD-IA family hydrolase [Marinilactibacillus piezotolerans]SFK13018.1 pyrophosphatase PpaX [Marinilactibacillus piezotolerans]
MEYTAALFDFDGTLANSNELINRTHYTVLEELFPGKYTMESVRQFNGPSLDEVYGTLVPDRKKEIITKYRQLNSELHDEMITLFTGVQKELMLLKEKAVKLAIVSTKKNDMIERGIKILGLENLFNVVIGSYSYNHYKPHPEPIYRALAELNVPHNQAIMIGDNTHDIESATNAGIPSVFVEWSQKTLKEIEPYEPTYTVKTMKELSEVIIGKNIDKQIQ